MSAKPVTAAELGAEVLEAAAKPWSVRTLVLDLEGSLEVNPVVSEEARSALGRLARAGWRVAVVSSRAATDARACVSRSGASGSGSGSNTQPSDAETRRRLV